MGGDRSLGGIFMENALMQRQENTLNGVREEKKTKTFTTLDMSKEENVDLILATQDECDYYIKDFVGKTIKTTGVFITEREVESVKEETGEVVKYNKHVTILFDENGKSYVTGSNAFYMSLDLIMRVKGYPTEENPINFEIVEKDAREKGHKYLKVRIAK